MMKKIKSSKFFVALSLLVLWIAEQIRDYYFAKVLDGTLPELELSSSWSSIFEFEIGFSMEVLVWISLGMMISIFWEYPERLVKPILYQLKAMFKKKEPVPPKPKHYYVSIELGRGNVFTADCSHRKYDLSTILFQYSNPKEITLKFTYHFDIKNIAHVIYRGIEHISVISFQHNPGEKKILVEFNEVPTAPYKLILCTNKQYQKLVNSEEYKMETERLESG